MTGKKFKITLIVLVSVLFAVILAIILFAAVNGYSSRYMISKLFPGTVENIYKPYKIVDTSYSTGAVVAGCEGYAYVLDDKNLTIYDDRGNEKSSEILAFEEAYISGGKKRVLIYDGPTGAYSIFEEGDQLFRGTVERTILGARMQNNGYVVFITKGRDGFLGGAEILDDSNEIIARYNYADRYPVSGCVIGNSGKFAVAGIYANDTNKTGIDIFEEYNQVPVAGINLEHMMPLVLPLGDKAYIAAGSKETTVFNSEGVELNSNGHNEIIMMDESAKGCLLTDRRTGTDKILFIGLNGQVKWSYSAGLPVDGITAGERHSYYWSGINAVCIDDKGKIIEMQGGFNQVTGIADIGNGKIVIATTGNLVFYEYH